MTFNSNVDYCEKRKRDDDVAHFELLAGQSQTPRTHDFQLGMMMMIKA